MSERIKRLFESAKSDCKAARDMALEAIEKHVDNIEKENLRLARKLMNHAQFNSIENTTNNATSNDQMVSNSRIRNDMNIGIIDGPRPKVMEAIIGLDLSKLNDMTVINGKIK